MKIAVVTIDDRDEYRKFEREDPFFGPAPSALLQGFTHFQEHEIHVVCCVKKQMQFPEKIAPNIFYHAEVIGQWGWLRGGYLGCIAAVRRMIVGIQPEIVHGQGTERYAAVTSVATGLPCVLTVHGNMRAIAQLRHARPFSFHWLTARLESWTLPRAAGVICLSRYTREQVEGLAKRTWVVPNAAGAEFFQQAAPRNPVPRLLCPAVICPRKNQNNLIRALDKIAAGQAFHLVFAGGLDEQADYSREFLELVKAHPWCEHVGRLSGEALRAEYRSANLLVLPSVEDNCPMAILEAEASGVPIAASGICGIPDLVTDGENGVLFQSRES